MLSDINQKLGEEDFTKLRTILKIQTVVLNTIHQFFYQRGYLQLMPVILAPYTDPVVDGGKRDLIPGSITYGNQELKLTQSMILHKQIAIGEGFEKILIFSPNVRLEHPEKFYTGRHLIEFTQVDFEVAFGTQDLIISIVEDLFKMINLNLTAKASKELKLFNRDFSSWPNKFPQFTTHELIEKYGKDWETSASQESTVPFWVLCHDRHFYEKVNYEKSEDHFLNFDLFYPEGFGSGLSGGEREYDFINLVRRMEKINLSRYEYHTYLLKAQDGLLRQSAGAGLGIERLVRFLTGMKHIGDIQVFRRVPGEEFYL